MLLDYLEILTADARKHEPLANNRTVVLYDDPYQAVFIAYGRIIGSAWNAKLETRYYEVETNMGNLHHPSYAMRIASPEEARALFVNVGGFE
jgi:hypothetical protein